MHLEHTGLLKRQQQHEGFFNHYFLKDAHVVLLLLNTFGHIQATEGYSYE